MALTNSQKEALDVVVSALVKTLIEEETEFSYKELLEKICNEVSFYFTVQSLVASVKRVLPANATIIHNSSNNYKILSYSFVMGSTFTKNHNLVTFSNNGSSEITYDFIENFDLWFIDERLKLRGSSLEKFTEHLFPHRGTYTRFGLLSFANLVMYFKSAFLIFELSACALRTANKESVILVPHIIVGV